MLNVFVQNVHLICMKLVTVFCSNIICLDVTVPSENHNRLQTCLVFHKNDHCFLLLNICNNSHMNYIGSAE